MTTATCMHCGKRSELPTPDGWIIRRAWYDKAKRFRHVSVAAFCGWLCEREHKALSTLDYSGGANMASELR